MNQKRKQEIIEMLNQQQTITNKELMEKFNISIETVRRDLKCLEKQGYLNRVYGGAVQNEPTKNSVEYEFHNENMEEKMAIAREAAKLVSPGDTIFLDEGTTVFAMTQYIKDIDSITVITNSLRVAITMCEVEGCTVILFGGKVEPRRLVVADYFVADSIGRYNVDKAFLGVSGISEHHFSDTSLETGYIRHYIIKESDKTFVLADHSKFGYRATVNICHVGELDGVITSEKTENKYIKGLQEAGVQVIVASEA